MIAGTPRRLLHITSRLDSRPTRFLLVGLSGAGVNMVVLWVATRLLGFGTIPAGIAAAVISTGTNFLLNDPFTWGDRRAPGARAKLGRLVRYYTTTAGGNLIYLGLLTTLVHWVRLYDLLANLIAIGVSGTGNYLVHNAWTWGRARG